MTRIQSRLFIKEYLAQWQKFCIDRQTVIFAEYFMQTAWFYGERSQNDGTLNFVQFFSGPLCSETFEPDSKAQYMYTNSCLVTGPRRHRGLEDYRGGKKDSGKM